MNNTKKLLLITILAAALADMKTAAGIADFGELDTEVAALQTAYDTDPATVLEADIDAVHDKMAAITTPNLNSVSTLWAQVDQG